MRTDHLTTTQPTPDRDNYLSALATLAGTMSRTQTREIHKSAFLKRHAVDPDTIRALVQLDCLEQDKAKPGHYRALDNLLHVTPEQVMERLAAMKDQPEAQPAKVATKLVDDKPAKQPREKKATPIAFFTPDPVEQEAIPQPPTTEELTAVADEMSERITTTINDTAAPETIVYATDATGTYFFNERTGHIERVDGKPVNLGDLCEPTFKEFARIYFPKDEKERVCVSYPTADQLLSDDRPPVNKVDFIQRLYDLKRLYQKASYAVTELAVILSEIDDMEKQTSN